MRSEQPLAPPEYGCPTCNQRTRGCYCSACGERRPATGPPTLRHYFDVAADLLTNFDTKVSLSLCGAVALPNAWAFFHIVRLYRFVLFEITLHTIQT